MNRFYYLIFACSFSINTFSQQVVTVIDGSLTDHDHVFEEWYHYSHVQYLYDKTLIGQSGTITDIQFEHSNNICTTNNITIYVGNTAKADFTGSSDWINSGLTLVYSGSNTPANGWYNINIADFYYDNTYNLAIVIDNDDGSYCGTSSYVHYYDNTSTYTMLRDRSSSDVGDYGSISSFGSRQMELANLQLVFLNTSPCSGSPSGGTASASVTSGCAVFNTNLTVTPSPTESGLSFQWQSSSDNITWTDIPGATTQSYTASVTNTTYYRRAITCSFSGLTGYSTSVLVVADCYNMSSGTIYTCSGHFYDSGGPSANYSNDETRTMTICSGNTSEYIKFVFSSFYTSSYDILEVFDGTSVSAPLIFSLSGQGSGNDMPPDIISTDSCITFRFTSDGSVNYAGWDAIISCTPQPNTIARDFCGGAAHICNLNGYTGKTSSFYGKDFPGNMCDVDEGTQPCTLFDGNIHNNSWITFTASAASASFDVTVANCSQDQGIQLGIYSGTACDNFSLMSDISLTEGTVGVPTALPNNTTTTVSVPFGAAPPLVPGQTYYIMIDGQSGDVCDYSILATSGVAQAAIDVTDTTVCSGQPLTLTASGGTGFTWSTIPPTSGAILNLTPASSGTYTVTITGGNPICPDQAEITSTVNVNPLPDGTAIPSAQSICSGQSMSNISLTADITGTTFSWSRNNPAGITTSIPMSGAGIPSGGIISGNTITNSTAGPLVVEFYILPTAPTTCAGSYDTVRVTVNPLPVASVTAFSDPTGCGIMDGSITVTPSGLYAYLWNTTPQQTTNTATGLASGSYQVTVSIGGCAITVNHSLSDPGSPAVGLSASDSAVCTGENIVFTASGITSGTYEFLVDGISVQGPSASDIWSSSALDNGQVVTVTGVEAGCNGSSPSVQITVTSLPVASVNPLIQSLCSDENSSSIIVNINAANSYFDWTVSSTSGLITDLPNGGTNVASGGSVIASHFINSGSSPVTVDITITPIVVGSSTCTGSTVTASITVNPLPVPALITTSDVTVCAPPWNGAATVINSTGLSPFTFSLDYGAFISDSIFYGLAAGSHTLTVQDANGCSSDTSFSVVAVTGAFIDSVLTDNVTCNGFDNGEIVVYSADAETYQVDGFPVQTDSIFTGIAPGTYTIHIWDAGSCEATQIVNITEPAILADSIFVVDPVLCYGNNNGALEVTPAGGTSPYYYQWDDLSLSTSQNAGNLPGNVTYSVTVTDDNGCVITDNIFLAEPPALTSVLSLYDLTCFGSNNGVATVIAGGGTPPYSYLWSDAAGSVTDTVSSLEADTVYFVSITDGNGCVKVDSFTLQQPTLLTYNIVQNNPPCRGNTGSAEILVAGGSPPYEYLWDSGSNPDSSYIDGLSADITYSVTATDSLGCTVNGTVMLTQPDSLSATLSVQNISCYGMNDGYIQVIIQGGTPPYAYAWSGLPSETSSIADSLVAGINYTVTVTDSHGCTLERTSALTQPDSLENILYFINISCNGFSDGSITVSVSGGTQPYAYSWLNAGTATGNTADSLAAGILYGVTVTDSHGCADSATVMLTEPDELTGNIVPENVSCFGYNDGNAAVSVSGGTVPYTYDWGAGPGPAVITGLTGSCYHYITVTDANGCRYNDSIYISQPTAISVSDSVGNGMSGFIELTVTGGTSGYSYLWSNSGVSEDIYGLSSGSYSVTITDQNGCTYTATYEVIADILIPNVITPNGDGINDDFEILNITVFEKVSIEIFSRWGERLFVFSGSGAKYADPANRWKGEELPMGAYFYIIKIDDMEPFTGAILLKY